MEYNTEMSRIVLSLKKWGEKELNFILYNIYFLWLEKTLEYLGKPQKVMNPTVTKLFFLKDVPLMQTYLGSYVSLAILWCITKLKKGFTGK